MILLVDEDVTTLHNLKSALEAGGFTAMARDEPYQALRLAGEEVPDLIICEVRMSEMSGFDFLHTYRSRFPARKTPFLFLSSLARPEQIARGLDKGADDYLIKPIDAVLLCAKVRSHLRLASSYGLKVTRGTLNQLPFTALIRQCERSGLTGVIEIFDEDLHASLPFAAGRLDDSAVSDELLERLVESATARFAIVAVPAPAPAVEVPEEGDEIWELAPEDEALFQALPEGAGAVADEAAPFALSALPEAQAEIGAPPDEIGAVETSALDAPPSGLLSGVQVGGKLFQVQTEVPEGIPRRVVTVATYHGKALIKRETVCARCAARDDLRRVMAAQHQGVEAEVRGRVERFIATSHGAAASVRPPSFDELFQQGKDRVAAGDPRDALRLWEAALAIEPGNVLLARNIELLRTRLAAS